VRVLIVDDEEPARAKLRRMLAAHPDVEVVGEASNGDDALRLAGELSPDAIFLDVQMPGRRQAAWPITTSMMAGRPGMDVAV